MKQTTMFPEPAKPNLYERCRDATHAYIGIHEGTCKAVCVDTADKETADFVSDMIQGGVTVERVTIEVARGALMKPWPQIASDIAP